MNGKDLMTALIHVEERYLDESERGYIGSREWGLWKPFLGMAACLAVIMAGAMLISWQAPRFPEETQGPGYSGVDTTPCDTAPVGAVETMPGITEPASAGEYRYIILKLGEYTADGFTGTIPEIVDLDQFPVGTVVTVVLKESLVSDLEAIREQFPEGTCVLLRLTYWDSENPVLYADRIEPAQ